MADFLEDMRAVRQRELEPLRREAGLPADLGAAGSEALDMENLWRYIEILEATVVGKATVLSLVAQATIPYARRDVLDGR